MNRRLAPALAALLLTLLAGCASGPPTATEGGVPIDATHNAKGQDSRVLFLVIHYTVADFPLSMKILTEKEVSAHYLLSDEPKPRIFRLVDESRRAWHSGNSAWGDNKRLNSSSIGIEIVHPGYIQGPNGQRLFLPFPKAQIDALIPLVQDIVKRHQIRPERILGHGEVSPSYKVDPGPTFPWKLFADLGITPPWPDAVRISAVRPVFDALPPDAAWYQRLLAKQGYAIEQTGAFDRQTELVLANFQMRYRPADYSGKPDAESAALLWVLTMPPSGDVLPATARPAASEPAASMPAASAPAASSPAVPAAPLPAPVPVAPLAPPDRPDPPLPPPAMR